MAGGVSPVVEGGEARAEDCGGAVDVGLLEEVEDYGEAAADD